MSRSDWSREVAASEMPLDLISNPGNPRIPATWVELPGGGTLRYLDGAGNETALTGVEPGYATQIVLRKLISLTGSESGKEFVRTGTGGGPFKMRGPAGGPGDKGDKGDPGDPGDPGPPGAGGIPYAGQDTISGAATLTTRRHITIDGGGGFVYPLPPSPGDGDVCEVTIVNPSLGQFSTITCVTPRKIGATGTDESIPLGDYYADYHLRLVYDAGADRWNRVGVPANFGPASGVANFGNLGFSAGGGVYGAAFNGPFSIAAYAAGAAIILTADKIGAFGTAGGPQFTVSGSLTSDLPAIVEALIDGFAAQGWCVKAVTP